MNAPDLEQMLKDDPERYLAVVEALERTLLGVLERGDLREDPDFATELHKALGRAGFASVDRRGSKPAKRRGPRKKIDPVKLLVVSAMTGQVMSRGLSATRAARKLYKRADELYRQCLADDSSHDAAGMSVVAAVFHAAGVRRIEKIWKAAMAHPDSDTRRAIDRVLASGGSLKGALMGYWAATDAELEQMRLWCELEIEKTFGKEVAGNLCREPPSIFRLNGLMAEMSSLLSEASEKDALTLLGWAAYYTMGITREADENDNHPAWHGYDFSPRFWPAERPDL